jgi:RNA polymerase sigma-70 factor (ECF subfamily)
MSEKIPTAVRPGDEELFAAARKGDEHAFAQLMQRYERPLYNFLLKFVGKPGMAEDVFQDTFLQVYQSSGTFEEGRLFRPWLYTIAANKARDALRSRSRKRTVQITSSSDEVDASQLWDALLQDTTSPLDVLDQTQEAQRVRNTVAKMPDTLREILVLAYFKHLSYKELAEVLDIPLGTVKSRLHAAVARFARDYRELTGSDERTDSR